MAKSQRQQVWERAGGCCEYCQLPHDHDPRPFHLDHIRPQKHDGPTVLENLALSCAACSLFKGPNPAGYDPETDAIEPLFNPRTQDWKEHFEWNGADLRGLTPIGRTTIHVLNINQPLRVLHRELLIELGVFRRCLKADALNEAASDAAGMALSRSSRLRTSGAFH